MSVPVGLGGVVVPPGTVIVSGEGAETPREALDRFLAAANSQDTRGLMDVFGDEELTVRERDKPADAERRAGMLICFVRNSKAQITGPVTGEGGRQLFQVKLTQGDNEATTPFTVARNKKNQRWYVMAFDNIVLQNKGFCSKKSQTGRP